MVALGSLIPTMSGSKVSWCLRLVLSRIRYRSLIVVRQERWLSIAVHGISPSAPPTNGKAPSTQSLRHRIRYHYTGNAEGSTLRLSLGCLLTSQLHIELRRVGSGKRFTFSNGEVELSHWMEENARVVWQVCEEPWKLEEKLISRLDLPLNLDQNTRHAYHAVLSRLRHEAKARARELLILR